MLNEAKEKTEDKMELTKKITLTEIWPCGGEGGGNGTEMQFFVPQYLDA